MGATLVVAGLALGVASTPHCALMCAAPCTAITGGRRGEGAGFLAARLASYMAGGAVAAASVSALSSWTRHSHALQPLWAMVQLGFLGLGLWWLMTGRMPRALIRDGVVPVRVVSRRRRAAQSLLAGLGWVAWPCPALQGALLLAALAGSALGGALVMAAFALASAPAVAVAPWLLGALRRWRSDVASETYLSKFGYRVAGLALCLSAVAALDHVIEQRLVAACAS